MLRDLVRFYGSEGAESDMKHDGNDSHTHCAYFIKQLVREVQSGGRSRRGAFLARVYRLVTLGIRQPFLDVRRQRHESYLMQQNVGILIDRAVILKMNYTVAFLNYVCHLGCQLTVSENKARAYFGAFAGSDKRFPLIRTVLTQ